MSQGVPAPLEVHDAPAAVRGRAVPKPVRAAAGGWAGALGPMLGAAVVVTGVSLPWYSTIEGLKVTRGYDTPPGRVLLVLAAATSLLALLRLHAGLGSRVRRVSAVVATTMAATAVVSLAAYLALLRGFAANPMSFGHGGPGVPVSVAGAVVAAALALHLRSDTQIPAVRPGRADPAVRLLVVALLAGGVIHLAVMPAHLREWWAAGAFMGVAGLSQLGGAILVARRASRHLLALAGIGSAALLAVWATSRISGLPFGPQAGRAESIGAADLISVLLDVLVLVLVLAARRGVRLPSRLHAPVLGRLASPAVIALGAFAVLSGAGVFQAAGGMGMHMG
jgi:hypothetical protein